jgi:hypothetical protein
LLFPLFRRASDKERGKSKRMGIGMKISLTGEVVVGGRDPTSTNPDEGPKIQPSFVVTVVIS